MRPARSIARDLHRDERGILVGYLVRIVLVFALLILTVEEGGQVIRAQIHAEDSAKAAAQAAANSWVNDHSLPLAAQAAKQAAAAAGYGAKVTALRISANGQAAIATVVVRAHTLVLGRIGPLKGLTEQHATDEEAPSSI